MLSGPFVSKHWMGACEDFAACDWVLVGLPYDGTCSFRPGSRFAPEQIRLASYGLETYSPPIDRDLDDICFYDAGELELLFGNRDKVLNLIGNAVEETLSVGKRWLGIGGEHLVTFPVVQTYLKRYPDLAIVHFDAHGDLRTHYLGETLSHATVMRLIMNNIPPERLVQIGIRSGPKAEFDWMRQQDTLMTSVADIPKALKRLADRPVFVTIDLDALDPSIFSGTGTPEPGGLTYRELETWIHALGQVNVVGADVVELAPMLDSTGVSTVVAAKIIREVMLAL